LEIPGHCAFFKPTAAAEDAIVPQRVLQQEIDRIKSEVSLERLVEAQGIELQRHGADLRGLCPFHDDHDPSLVITPRKNVWHCLGACNKGGSVIDWVMQTRGVSFRHAVELLRAEHPSLSKKLDHVVRKGTTEAVKLETPFEISADDQQVLAQVVDYYHRTLKQSPEALKYLAGRGLIDPEMIDRFKIGFANRTLGYRLPDKNRKAGAELRGRLERLGVFRSETGHEHFNGSIVIPVLDAAGAVVEMYGRKITRVLTKGLAHHLYMPGPHKGVWNEEALAASKEIILCESLIDALTFWCAGYPNVTASYGVNGFTDDHRKAFQTYGIQNVWIAYDRDEAGDRAAGQLKEELAAMGIGSHRVLFPKGMDANEYALKATPAAQSLGVLLNRAEWWARPAGAPSHPASRLSPESPAATAAGKSAELETLSAAVAAGDSGEKALQANGEDELVFWQGDRRYRVRGLGKNTGREAMKVSVLVSRQTEFHADTFDMNVDRQRLAFIKRAAEELGLGEEILRKDVGRLFLALEGHQAENTAKSESQPAVSMTDRERADALALLSDPRLLERILADFDRCGLAGEETNKLVAYLATVSRRLESPLAVVVQSSSASGKSSLMEAALAFVPEEERVHYSAMTGQSLYYMTGTDLKHKVLAVAEGEGASRAAYALKLLQSEGSLSIASTGKDPVTGKLITLEYRVEGPVMILTTTTAMDADEELLNRCFVLSVDEDRLQTQAIHKRQREAQTLEGLLGREERKEIVRQHQNAQRLLDPVQVVNPYAKELTFPDGLLRSRRDHLKYLTLILAIAFLHQYQRPRKTTLWRGRTLEYIEATAEDIAVANRLVSEVLGRSLDDLRPETRRMLLAIEAMVKDACGRQKVDRSDHRFSRRQVREHTGWSATQVRIHMERLQEMEYLIAHRGGRGQSFVYELAFESTANPTPQFPGLIHVYDANLTGTEAHLTASKRGQNGGVTAAWRSGQTRSGQGREPDFTRNLSKRTTEDHRANAVVAEAAVR
jgi:DNA primase catalytic core